MVNQAWCILHAAQCAGIVHGVSVMLQARSGMAHGAMCKVNKMCPNLHAVLFMVQRTCCIEHGAGCRMRVPVCMLGFYGA